MFELLDDHQIENDNLSKYILEMRKRLYLTINKMKQIDNSGMFQSDDYVGVTFSSLVNALEDLDKFLSANILEFEDGELGLDSKNTPTNSRK